MSSLRQRWKDACFTSPAVQWNIGRHGLETVDRRTPPYDAPEFADVCRWAWRLITLAVTSAHFLRVVWNNCLTNPPLTGDALVHANLIAFRDYYMHQWLRNREKAELWNAQSSRKWSQKLPFTSFGQSATPDWLITRHISQMVLCSMTIMLVNLHSYT